MNELRWFEDSNGNRKLQYLKYVAKERNGEMWIDEEWFDVPVEKEVE